MIKFIQEYIKNPREIGAIAPSSKTLAKSILKDIDFNNIECIVEYGPGTGIFSDYIVNSCKNRTKIILIELNHKFYINLKEKYSNNTNVVVIKDSAENISEILEEQNVEKVDYIISGLPFTSLPKDVSNNILSKTKDVLDKNGEFRTFQYSKLKKNILNENFKTVKHNKILRNIPPAYIFKCEN